MKWNKYTAVAGDELVYLKGKKFVILRLSFTYASLVLHNNESEIFWELKFMQGCQK